MLAPYTKPRAHLVTELQQKIDGYVQLKKYYQSQHLHAERQRQEAARLREMATRFCAQAAKIEYDIDHWREGYDSADAAVERLRAEIDTANNSVRDNKKVDELMALVAELEAIESTAQGQVMQ